jgi:hypothetical protein
MNPYQSFTPQKTLSVIPIVNPSYQENNSNIKEETTAAAILNKPPASKGSFS